MAALNYDASLRRLLVHEGGYTNHPSDPGGPTNFGITIHDYRKYINADAIAADIKAMNIDQAKSIYRAKYWDSQRCDELPSGVDYAIFDYGVNSGIGRSGKVLRRLLKLPDNTSVVNDAVIAAADAADNKVLIGAIQDERLRFLRSLKTWNVFGAGWGRRVSEVRDAALAMAVGKPARFVPAPREPSSASRADKSTTVKSMARSTEGNAAIGGGTLAAIQTANEVSASIKEIKANTEGTGIFDVLSHLAVKPGFWIGVAVIGVAAFIWWRRRQRLQEQGV